MKLISTLILWMTVWSSCYAFSLNHGDTVIIELGASKIIIYTQNKSDLTDLEKYDINQMIKDLNDQLVDSVEYLEISSEEGKPYLKKEASYVDGDRIDIDLGNIQVEVDPNEMEEYDEDWWENREKSTEIVERAKRTTNHFNVDLGVNNWLEEGSFPDAEGANYTVKPWGSWYLALNSVNRSWLAGPVFLEWGAGVSWYSWKLQDASFRITKGDEQVELVSNPDETGLKSKLTASYFNLHLVPVIDFANGRRKLTRIESTGIKIRKYSRRGFRFGMGGYAGYRLGSHTKFKFNSNGSTEKDNQKDNFFLENFRYGLRAQIGWRDIEFFANYDLNDVFSSGRGPASAALNAISFGVTL